MRFAVPGQYASLTFGGQNTEFGPETSALSVLISVAVSSCATSVNDMVPQYVLGLGRSMFQVTVTVSTEHSYEPFCKAVT